MHPSSFSLSHVALNEDVGYLPQKRPSYIAAINASQSVSMGMNAAAANVDGIQLTEIKHKNGDFPADIGGFVGEGKKVDFVLVYKEGKAEDDEEEKEKRAEHEDRREEFESNLVRCGLQVQRVQASETEVSVLDTNMSETSVLFTVAMSANKNHKLAKNELRDKKYVTSKVLTSINQSYIANVWKIIIMKDRLDNCRGKLLFS